MVENMKSISVIVLCLFGLINCQKPYYPTGQYQPQVVGGGHPFIPIVNSYNDHNFDGSYKFGYETGNGISVQEQGVVKNAGQKDLEAQTAQGVFTYTSPEGVPISVRWFADESGFHAEGAHLPTPPPIPPAIAKSLALQQHQPQGPAAAYPYYQQRRK